MEAVFLKILNMSITASWLVLAVLLMRLVLKKAPRFWSVIMWAIVGLRLVLPFNFESVLSLIPSAETVPPEILLDRTPEIQTGIDVLNDAVNPIISQSFAPAPMASINPLQILTLLAGWVWVIGMAAMAAYSLISCLRIRHKLREAAPLQGNVYLCDRIDTPFIFGLFRPKIYLPSAMAAEDVPFVLAHEQAHLKRKDHLWKPLGFLLLTVYWFNPLLWVAYILLCRDIEAACDEKVLTDMGEEVKKPYSQALVNCSVPRKAIAACPLAFGEVNVKSRIKKVLSYKKPAFWLLIAAVVVCIVLSVCFLTDPRTVNEQMQIFLDCRIAEHFQSDKSAGNACCVDYEILGTKKTGKTTTVYMWVLYEEYNYQNGQLQQQTGSHIPTVITARKEDGNYRLVEYFEPRDGAYNPGDIKAKFPWYLWPKAMDSQRYYKKQQAACLEMAEQYFRENPPSVSSFWDREDLESLRLRYPRYFETLPETGMTVYVWQMAAGNYCWGLLPDGEEYTWDKSDALQLLSLDALQAIIEDYGLKQDQVTICPIQVIHSSYLYNIDETYTHNVTVLFWSRMYAGTQPSALEYLRGLIDAVDYDIDGDGVTEHCELHYGATSGLFTFGLVAYENGQPEYCNIYLSDWGELSFAEQADDTLGVQRDGRSQDSGMEVYDIVVADGYIQLIGDVTVLEYWGLQGVEADLDDLKDELAGKQEEYYEENLHREGPLVFRYDGVLPDSVKDAVDATGLTVGYLYAFDAAQGKITQVSVGASTEIYDYTRTHVYYVPEDEPYRVFVTQYSGIIMEQYSPYVSHRGNITGLQYYGIDDGGQLLICEEGRVITSCDMVSLDNEILMEAYSIEEFYYSPSSLFSKSFTENVSSEEMGAVIYWRGKLNEQDPVSTYYYIVQKDEHWAEKDWTAVPTEPKVAKPNPYGYPFIFDGSNPSMQDDADISGCVEGYLYWYNVDDKNIFLVTDKTVVQKENMVNLIAGSETHVYFVTEEEPTKIYAAPLEDFSKQEVIYESTHGKIDDISTGRYQYTNTAIQITEGSRRFVWFDLTQNKTELFMEQYFLLSASVETSHNTAQDENGDWYLVDLNQIFFFGKLSEDDTEVKSYHYFRDTGKVVVFDYS